MTKKLILAEKPSVGLTYAALLSADRKFDGYMEGTDCIVTWCFGHLAELASPETYDEKYSKWNRSDLPIVPQNWILKPSREKKKQFEIIKTLMHREDVSEVINACDAGREGELIFRYVYELAKCRKPMKRLWISSMEDDAIMDGFRNLRSGSDFDSLYQAALCRAKADWLVGMNATRLFSVLYHRTLNVGRVVSPTLALIVERDTEIRAFVPQPYYTVCSDFEGFSAVSGKYNDKTEAETVLHAVHHAPFTVKSVERKEKREKAPALYDLTTLQRDANRLLGYTAQQTLDYLQSLYEKKLTTYPRTDSRYLTDDMKDTVNSISLLCAGILNTDRQYHPDTKSVCDSRKVSDHHAIIPTILAGTAELDDLPNGEREILCLIARQVLLATSPACEYAETLVTLDCNGVSFTAKGKTVLDMGWKSYLDNEPTEKVLPDLTVGMTLTTETCTIRDGKTKAPAAYTEDTLLHAMETAGSKETDDDVERKGIGTPATRAAMIEKLISAGYVERRKNSLVPASIGNSLITVLPEQLQSPLLTAEWENKLKL
ncbi:MAG: DNA topoisomerase 3, partial [Clostridia bacterium]|nr:DNA topoisomerase 3 [Clostridia bacterium]